MDLVDSFFLLDFHFSSTNQHAAADTEHMNDAILLLLLFTPFIQKEETFLFVGACPPGVLVVSSRCPPGVLLVSSCSSVAQARLAEQLCPTRRQ